MVPTMMAAFVAALLAATPVSATESSTTTADNTGVAATTEAKAPKAGDPNLITREGLDVTFSSRPMVGRWVDERDMMRGDRARIRFEINDAETGEPVEGLYPGAWMDHSVDENANLSCREKTGMYLSGSTGIRPLLDMNSYFVMVMNRDSTISVIDPAVLVAGVEDNFFTQIILKRPAGDWTTTEDEKRMFVSMPRAHEVAVVDTVKFETTDYIKTGTEPLRVALQPDERYLWVGFRGRVGEPGGVTVIDTQTLEPVAEIETGEGHHELAFSEDSRYAFVSNRDSGTVTVVDIETLEILADVAVGDVAISLAYSPLSQRVYAADGRSGRVSVIDPESQKIVGHFDTRPGVGPMRFEPEGRWGFLLNPTAGRVSVIDASDNSLAHEIRIEDLPYQVSFSRNFAYVRAMSSSRVSMINLSELGGSEPPPVNTFEAGSEAPDRVDSLSIADSVAAVPTEAAVIVANPADDNLYFYMEGMNFPRGSFRSYGHSPRAVTVVDRALREVEPGVYQSEIKLPMSGKFDVAFVLDAPRVMHCFSMWVDENPAFTREEKPPSVEYLVTDRQVVINQDYRLRFRLVNPNDGSLMAAIEDVKVRYFQAPNRGRTDLAASEVEPGVYEAALGLPRSGNYYVYVAAPSRGLGFDDLPYLSLRAVTARAVEAAADDTSGQQGKGDGNED
jgi:DNA-binding beta-propeller fold protein YncE